MIGPVVHASTVRSGGFGSRRSIARLSGRTAVLLQWVAGERGNRGRAAWFAVLMGALCFEGLGRKYVPQVPAPVFYFLKDAVLIAGLFFFGLRPVPRMLARKLYGPFVPVLALAGAWTVVQMFNPQQQSMTLALTGLRSYWLWWLLAPLVIASALRSADDQRRAVVIVALFSLVIAMHALQQFGSPAGAPINATSLYEGESRIEVAIISTTGRVRVASTFAYLAGFADYGMMVPPLLLGFAIDSRERLARGLAVLGAVVVLATMGMSGSRAGVGLSAIGVAVVVTTSGFLRKRTGRWAAALAVIGAVAVWSVGRDALSGVGDRWRGEDTAERIFTLGLVLPPVALTQVEYPPLGLGTGMQQNARFQLGGVTDWGKEEEPARYLVELGAPGYLLVWVARLGLMLALLKVARTLRRGGKPGVASVALAYAVLTMFGQMTFDHVWQALYFTGLGILLSHYVTAVEAAHRAAQLARSAKVA